MIKKYIPTIFLLIVLFAACTANYSDNGYARPGVCRSGVRIGFYYCSGPVMVKKQVNTLGNSAWPFWMALRNLCYHSR